MLPVDAPICLEHPLPLEARLLRNALRRQVLGGSQELHADQVELIEAEGRHRVNRCRRESTSAVLWTDPECEFGSPGFVIEAPEPNRTQETAISSFTISAASASSKCRSDI